MWRIVSFLLAALAVEETATMADTGRGRRAELDELRAQLRTSTSL
jgi:hypothetical protein